MRLLAISILFLLACADLRAQTPFHCDRTDTPAAARAEGLAELIADITLSCKGGQAGSVRNYSLLVSVNGEWALRKPFLATSSAAWNEALLLIGDPTPQKQVPCLPTPAFDSCSAAPGGAPNTFPARQIGKGAIAFTNIPIAAGDATVTLRVANLRVAAARSAQDIITSVLMFDNAGALMNLFPRDLVSAKLQPALTFSIADANGNPALGSTPPLVTAPKDIPLNTPTDAHSIRAVFEENFAEAFRRRNIATTSFDPGRVESQSIPGLLYQTESGFFNAAFPPASPLSIAGLADTGTRLRVTLENIPDATIVWVSIRDVAGTTNFDPVNPKALLTYTGPTAEGPYHAQSPYIPGYTQLYVDKGKTSAAWEVVSSDPGAIDKFVFIIAITGLGTPGLGTADIRGSIAPFLEQPGVSASATTFPQFATDPVRLPAFRITTSIQNPPISHVSAASYTAGLAPASFAAAFGTNLSAVTATAAAPWPATLAGMEVEVTDTTGVRRLAPMLMVSPSQVNYVIPEATRPGPALINLTRQGVVTGSGLASIRRTAPGMFSADDTGSGLAAATMLTLTASGANEPAPIAQFNPQTGLYEPRPITLNPAEPVYLSLYGTGIRNRTSLDAVSARIGGVLVPVLYAGPQSEGPGLDQVNIGPLPISLQGRGRVDVIIQADGELSNILSVFIR